MLERAEKRSKNLGITGTSKFPLSEFNQDNSNTTTTTMTTTKNYSVKTKQQNISPNKSNSTSPKKSTSFTRDGKSRIVKNITEREYDGYDSKENCDVAVEINITTGPNIQVQVEVEEQDVDSSGNTIHTDESDDSSAPMIRDVQRNRLQRLGAMYSETENLSSPIHRTEGRFHEGLEDDAGVTPRGGNKTRFGKLAELASSINSWEDENATTSTHSDVAMGPPKPKRLSSPKKNIQNERKITISNSSGAVPKKYNAPQPPKQPQSIISSAKKTTTTTTDGSSETKQTGEKKQLKWDQKVMDALESQGFTRRESSTTKYSYDYADKKPSIVPGSEIVKKDTPPTSIVSTPTNASAKKPEITRSLVSGRAAIFETSSNASSATTASARNQKDPAEMSLKDRMALFEKNKGQALIPIAPLGMSASAKQIMGEQKQTTPVHPIQLTTPNQSTSSSRKEQAAPTAGPSKVQAYNVPGEFLLYNFFQPLTILTCCFCLYFFSGRRK